MTSETILMLIAVLLGAAMLCRELAALVRQRWMNEFKSRENDLLVENTKLKEKYDQISVSTYATRNMLAEQRDGEIRALKEEIRALHALNRKIAHE